MMQPNRTLFLLVMVATTLAKSASAFEKFLYEGDPKATAVTEFFGVASLTDVFPTRNAKVVKLYNPYCHHCVSFKPTYVKAAQTIQMDHPEVEFYAISCLHHDKICREKFDFQSYPTLLAIPYGVNDNFQGIAVPLAQDELVWDKIQAALGQAGKNASVKRGLQEVPPLTSQRRHGHVRRTKNNPSESKEGVEAETPEDDEDNRVGGEEQEDNDEEQDNGYKRAGGEEQEDNDKDGDGVEQNKKAGGEEQADSDPEGDGVEQKNSGELDNGGGEEHEGDDEEGDGVERKNSGDLDNGGGEEQEDNDEEGDGVEQKNSGDLDNGEEKGSGDERVSRDLPEDKAGDEEDSGDGRPDTDHAPFDIDHNAEDEPQVNGQDANDPSAKMEYSANRQFREKHYARTPNAVPKKEYSEYSDAKRLREQRYKAGLKGSHSRFSGAQLGRLQPHVAAQYNEAFNKKFKERLEMRDKMRLFTREKERPKLEGLDEATKLMKANQVNTVEFEKKKQKYLDYMNRARRQRKKATVDAAAIRSGKIGTIPYQKMVSRPRIVENVPVVKLVLKMSEEEELILDTTLAFVHAFKYDVFKSRAPTSEQITALMDWLDLVYIGLPPEWGIQSLVYDLKFNIVSITKRYEDLRDILDKHKLLRTQWSPSCTAQGGLPCGYWKLFHTITVGVAEHRGGLNLIAAGIRSEKTKTFSPMEAADTMRDYIERFFYCDDCAHHFLEVYDDCDKNRRCARLAENEEMATPADWKELSLWLWEFHNDVSVRVLNEKADDERKRGRVSLLGRRPEVGPGGATTEQAIKVLWPTLDGCVTCFNLDGTWNEASVFRHLENTYWPGLDSEFNILHSRLIFFEGDEQAGRLLFYVLAIGLLMLACTIMRTLKSPYMQRTVLLAKTLGPKLKSGKKERSA